MASTTCLVKLMKGSDWDISVMRWFLLVPAESGRGGEDLGSPSQMCVCVHVSKIGQTQGYSSPSFVAECSEGEESTHDTHLPKVFELVPGFPQPNQPLEYSCQSV